MQEPSFPPFDETNTSLKFFKPQILETESTNISCNKDFEFIISTPEDIAEAKRTEASRPKKSRMKPTPHQLARLNQVFSVNRSPDTITRNQLADELQMNPRSVQIWFQNKRAKYKKVCLASDKMSCNISPKSPESDFYPSSLPLMDTPSSSCNLEPDLQMYSQTQNVDLPSPKPTPRLLMEVGSLPSSMPPFTNLDFFSLGGIYSSYPTHRRSSLIPSAPKFSEMDMTRRNSEPMIHGFHHPSAPIFIPQSDQQEQIFRGGSSSASFPSSSSFPFYK